MSLLSSLAHLTWHVSTSTTPSSPKLAKSLSSIHPFTHILRLTTNYYQDIQILRSNSVVVLRWYRFASSNHSFEISFAWPSPRLCRTLSSSIPTTLPLTRPVFLAAFCHLSPIFLADDFRESFDSIFKKRLIRTQPLSTSTFPLTCPYTFASRHRCHRSLCPGRTPKLFSLHYVNSAHVPASSLSSLHQYGARFQQ